MKIICILDYCKTTTWSIGVIPSMDPLLLCTNMTNYAQEEDSKMGQLIYLLQRVILMKFIPNEQILTGNT